jgi:hypothetical protein
MCRRPFAQSVGVASALLNPAWSSATGISAAMSVPFVGNVGLSLMDRAHCAKSSIYAIAPCEPQREAAHRRSRARAGVSVLDLNAPASDETQAFRRPATSCLLSALSDERSPVAWKQQSRADGISTRAARARSSAS